MQKKRRQLAVYAGSFDPPTIGHQWMIDRGVELFPKLIVAVGVNPEKHFSFTVEQRMQMLREITRRHKNLIITAFGNRFLIDYAQEVNATHILRGIRSESDYEYERTMRNINGDLNPKIATVFLMPPRDIAEVSSSMVKGLIGPDDWERIVKPYVPAPVYRRLLRLRGVSG